MVVRNISESEHTALLALVDGSLRPADTVTRAVDDYPVALGLGNRGGLFVEAKNGRLDACLACLVRPFRTSLGELPVAAIGSVVTHPAQRGEGLSRRLQQAVLARLQQQSVPLAVLWSDQPQWYAGRGFRAAGVEYHVDLTAWRPEPLVAPDVSIRPYRAADTAHVGRLYRRHAFFTQRRAGDGRMLYGMSGSAGLVLTDKDDTLQAYIFCGKGADFPGYVLEWGGEARFVALLLLQARNHGLARRLLVPQGGIPLLELLTHQGAKWFAQNSGLWCILRPDLLAEFGAGRTEAVNDTRPGSSNDPVAWLGHVDSAGRPRPGPLQLAVWGFDSV